MNRRDLLSASKLLLRHKMDASNPLLLGFAAEFLAGRKTGEITTSFKDFLEEDISDDDDATDDEDFGDIEEIPEREDDTVEADEEGAVEEKEIEDPTKP
jgi:hypothetical protein